MKTLFVTLLLGPGFSAYATDRMLSSAECARLLYEDGLAHREHLRPIEQLASALGGRPAATLRVRHRYARSAPKFVAPLDDYLHGFLVSRVDLVVQDPTDRYAILRGTTEHLLSYVNEHLVARYGPSDLSFQVISDTTFDPRAALGRDLKVLDHANAATLFDELAAAAPASLTIYDVDHDHGLFAFRASDVGDVGEFQALGLTSVDHFDRATFASAANVYALDGYLLFSKSAFDLLANAGSGPLNLSDGLRAAIEQSFGPLPDEAPPAAARAIEGRPAPVAAERVPEPGPSPTNDPAWIRALGPRPGARAIVIALCENDPAPYAGKRYLIPDYLRLQLVELWRTYRHGRELGETQLKPTDAKSVFYGGSRRADDETEAQWARFFAAGGHEPGGIIEPAARAKLDAFLTRVARLQSQLVDEGFPDAIARAVVNIELELPEERVAAALAPPVDVPAEDLPFRQWRALELALGLNHTGDVTLERVDLVTREYDRLAAQQQRRFLEPLAERPILQLGFYSASEAMKLGVSEADLKAMVAAWHGRVFLGDDADKRTWTMLYPVEGSAAVKVGGIVAILRQKDGVFKIDLLRKIEGATYKFETRLKKSKALEPLTLAARFTDAAIEISPNAQVKVALQQGVGLPVLARVLRRGEVIETFDPLHHRLRDADGAVFEVVFVRGEGGELRLQTFRPAARVE